MIAARLRRSTDIAAVRAEGRPHRRTAFNARVRRTDGPGTRLAVVAPRTVGSAVTRNRARRRVREAFRLGFASVAAGPSIDVLITVRPAATRAVFAVTLAEVRSFLAEIGR